MSGIYIKLNVNFYTNRKTIKLKSLIGLDAYWIPPKLWCYAAQNQPDGDFSSYSSEELSMLIGCDKYASSIAQVLQQAGFLDQDMKVHDWEDHNGYHKNYSERAKKAANARWGKDKKKETEKEKDIDIDIETSIASSMLQAYMVRIGKWFNRRESTKWSDKEIKSLKSVVKLNTSDEDLSVLESMYLSNYKYKRKDIVTLLNNWNGEIDRARELSQSNPLIKQDTTKEERLHNLFAMSIQ